MPKAGYCFSFRLLLAAWIVIQAAMAAGAPFQLLSQGESGTESTGPSAVTVDMNGNLFVADTSRIRRLTPDGQIRRVAGNEIGSNVDGGPARVVRIGLVRGMTVDAAGNLFFSGNNRVYKLTPKGVISTYAGSSPGGFSGDNGPASSAQFNYPEGLAVDSSGTLFIADRANHRIRKVTPSGIITTIAGNGTPGASGDGGAAVVAQLNAPTAVAVSTDGNIFVADERNYRIRKISSDGVISSVPGFIANHPPRGHAGPVPPRVLDPFGIAVDLTGNLLVTELMNNRIRKITLDGAMTIAAGMSVTGPGGFDGDSGPATRALLASPRAVAMDSSGNMFIADYGNKRVRKVTPAGIISTVKIKFERYWPTDP